MQKKENIDPSPEAPAESKLNATDKPKYVKKAKQDKKEERPQSKEEKKERKPREKPERTEGGEPGQKYRKKAKKDLPSEEVQKQEDPASQSMADADELLHQAATAGTHQVSASATPSKSPVKEAPAK